MQIKRFEAKNMTEALNQIKKELGRDAVILSARSTKRSGMFSSMKKAGVEVTAAVDNQNLEYQKKQRYRLNKKRNNSALSIHGKIYDTYGYTKYADNNQNNYYRRLNTNKKDHSLKRLDHGQKRINIYRRLLSQGVKEEAASEIEWELRQNSIFQKDMSKRQVRESLSFVFRKMGLIKRNESLKKRKQNILIFIGATGVGKTTAIAKMAINQTIKLNKNVGIVNLDHYRVAATEQLEGYGNIAGIPISVATKKNELREVIKNYKDKETILIDTPAVTLNNNSRIQYLKDILEKNKSYEIHLVISASTKESDILGIMKKLDGIAIDYFIFSKIDESESFENLFNVLMKKKIPVSYITSNQGIKNGIKEISANILADLMLKRTNQMALEEEERDRLAQKKKSIKTLSIKMKNQFLANKNSDVYHTQSCKWTKMINKENIIIFQNSKEAEIKNFKPCRSCCQKQYKNLMKKKETIINQKLASYKR